MYEEYNIKDVSAIHNYFGILGFGCRAAGAGHEHRLARPVGDQVVAGASGVRLAIFNRFLSRCD
jgi:hypothetical protein